MHFTGGEIIPPWVLCPWRAHLLASTLPAVARATAACSMRCAWMVGRGLGLLRGTSSGWCVRCKRSCSMLRYASTRRSTSSFFPFQPCPSLDGLNCVKPFMVRSVSMLPFFHLRSSDRAMILNWLCICGRSGSCRACTSRSASSIACHNR